jgi:hypothetical protein
MWKTAGLTVQKQQDAVGPTSMAGLPPGELPPAAETPYIAHPSARPGNTLPCHLSVAPPQTGPLTPPCTHPRLTSVPATPPNPAHTPRRTPSASTEHRARVSAPNRLRSDHVQIHDIHDGISSRRLSIVPQLEVSRLISQRILDAHTDAVGYMRIMRYRSK